MKITTDFRWNIFRRGTPENTPYLRRYYKVLIWITLGVLLLALVIPELFTVTALTEMIFDYAILLCLTGLIVMMLADTVLLARHEKKINVMNIIMAVVFTVLGVCFIHLMRISDHIMGI